MCKWNMDTYTIKIANAFPEDIFIKIHFRPTIKSRLNLTFRKPGTGFHKVPKYEVSTYQPPDGVNEASELHVSMYHLKEDGSQNMLLRNEKFTKRTSIIITSQGSIADTDERNPWMSISSKVNYLEERCHECVALGKVCVLCFVGTKLAKVEESIGKFNVCEVGATLIKLRGDLLENNICSKNDQCSKIITQIEELIKMYGALETQTESLVRKIASYGEALEEAAEDFQEDGNLPDFLREAKKLDEVKLSLRDVNGKHGEIKITVTMIEDEATRAGEIFSKKMCALQKSPVFDEEDEDLEYSYNFALLTSIPVFGQFVSAGQGAYRVGAAAVEGVGKLDLPSYIKVPLQGAGGALGAVGGGVGYVTLSIVHVPVAPLIWAHHMYKAGAMKSFSDLAAKFLLIAGGMSYVEDSLGEIQDCLHDIEDKLDKGLKAQGTLLTVTDPEKQERMAERARTKAQALISACKDYSNKIKSCRYPASRPTVIQRAVE